MCGDTIGTPFAGLAGVGEQAVHGTHRAEIEALVEQRGIDGGRRAVGETHAVEGFEQGAAFCLVQRQRRGGSRHLDH